MNSNVKGLIVVAIIGVGVYFAYKKLMPSKSSVAAKKLGSEVGNLGSK